MTYTIIKKLDSKNRDLLEQEKLVKEQLDSDIPDICKNVDLEQRLKEVFEQDRSHTVELSKL